MLLELIRAQAICSNSKNIGHDFEYIYIYILAVAKSIFIASGSFMWLLKADDTKLFTFVMIITSTNLLAFHQAW